jgi:LmbE family N-acetylglucosaminyl deacetylase
MTILFILSHPDDEAFGPAGTIAKLAKEQDVCVVSLCKGDRPGNEEVASARKNAFNNSCQTLGALGIMYDSSDVHLEYHQALADVNKIIKQVNPTVVYTHNISDVHKDHRLTAEVVLAACRPTLTSPVQKLYMCEIPASTYWTFGQMEPIFVPNVYTDVTKYIELKQQVMNLYNTELYKYPDARSVTSMVTLAKYRGTQIGVEYAEAFKLVFSKE